MDAKGDCLLQTQTPSLTTTTTTTTPHKYYPFLKRTIQFLLPVSVFSFFITAYFSGLSIFLSYYYLQFSTLAFPLFAQALDRKYMFLLCNGILAFLAKNLRFSNHGSHQIDQLPQVLEVPAVQENLVAVSTDYDEKQIAWQQERDSTKGEKEAQQAQQTGDFVLENIVTEEEEEEQDYYDDNDEANDSATLEGTLAVDEVSDVRVSTEELNKKFEEFIKKMKEEIRIEAQQQLITV